MNICTDSTHYIVLAETARYIGCGFTHCSISSISIIVVCHIYYSTNTINLAEPGEITPYTLDPNLGEQPCDNCPFDRRDCDINEGLCRNCSSLNYEACIVKLYIYMIFHEYSRYLKYTVRE